MPRRHAPLPQKDRRLQTQAHDSELERLQDERVHLRIKLHLMQNSGIRDVYGIERLHRSLELIEMSIAGRLRRAKTSAPDAGRDRVDYRPAD